MKKSFEICFNKIKRKPYDSKVDLALNAINEQCYSKEETYQLLEYLSSVVASDSVMEGDYISCIKLVDSERLEKIINTSLPVKERKYFIFDLIEPRISKREFVHLLKSVHVYRKNTLKIIYLKDKKTLDKQTDKFIRANEHCLNLLKTIS